MATPPVMKIVPPYTPELLPEVQGYVEEFVNSRLDCRVLEMGSGWSTIWFGLMKSSPQILSLEHHEDWAREVTKVYNDVVKKVPPVLLMHQSLFFHVMDQMISRSFDVVYIDGYDEERIHCTISALPLLKQEGLLILDDTHWPMWKSTLEYIRSLNLREVTISGYHIRKDKANHYHHTTLFYRSTNDRL